MPGLYYEDMEVGSGYTSPGRTITETDVVMFAAMSGDYNELHTSATYGASTPFGQRVAHGLLGLSISHGLLFRCGLLDGTGLAFLGIENWRFTAPIRFGDTVHVRVRVADKRPSRSRPEAGIVWFDVEVVRQDDTVVQSGRKAILVRRRA